MTRNLQTRRSSLKKIAEEAEMIIKTIYVAIEAAKAGLTISISSLRMIIIQMDLLTTTLKRW